MRPDESPRDVSLLPRLPIRLEGGDTILDRWRFRLAWIAAGVAAVWALVAGLMPALGWLYAAGPTRYAPQPVAAAHRTWDADCASCHPAWAALSPHSTSQLLVSAGTDTTQGCTVCHAGPPHHKQQTPQLACSDCHHEHRGVEASLTRVADGDCTRCHAALERHVADGVPAFVKTVSSFSPGEHPPFRSIKADPGQLNFNHARHMSKGMGAARLSLGKLPPTYRAFVAKQQTDQRDEALVELTCGVCHQTENRGIELGGTSSAYSDGSAGTYMLPIRYEQHCQACHPLSFDVDKGGKGQNTQAQVPHHLEPVDLRAHLEGYYSRALLSSGFDVFERFVPTRPLPRKLPQQDQEKARLLIQGKVSSAEQFLMSKGRCLKCHELGVSNDHPKAVGGGPALAAQRVVPVAVPDRWYRHASFSHAAHHAVKCLECHTKAEEATDRKAVLVPDMDTCVRCHAPRRVVDGKASGGARYDCVECHRYHNGKDINGDNLGDGPGAVAREPKLRRTVDDFLTAHP